MPAFQMVAEVASLRPDLLMDCDLMDQEKDTTGEESDQKSDCRMV